ncbi:MAG: DNA mismatch repair protein MutS [Lachnospiraceae bacterium]|nr:DNA mismatch repair protein MutS [Lachnospiraceae bacterium]
MNNKDFYEDKFNQFSEEQKILEKKFSNISTLRVLSFLIGLAMLLIGIFDDKPVAGFFGVAFLLAFLVLVKLHGDIVKKQEEAKSKTEVAKRYVDRFSDAWRNFEETGEEYLNENDTVTRDIDLLGKSSLYQMINTAHTKKGKSLFANELRLEAVDIGKLSMRNKAVAELTEKKDFSIAFEAAGLRAVDKKQKQDTDKFIACCDNEKTGFIPLWMEIARFVLPVIEIALIGCCVFGGMSYGYPLAGFIFVLAFAGFTMSKTEDIIAPLYSLGASIEDYEDMLTLIEAEEFNSGRLMELKENAAGEEGAVSAFKSLKKISQAYNISYNPFLHIIFTGILLWDYQLAHLTSNWKKKYGKNLSKIFDVIAELEELISLSVLGCIRETAWADIEVNDNKAFLLGTDMYHPLINPDTVVSNSIELKGGITIITGSNMSGKTTFLRTIAVNLVLAYMGAPVCAKEFKAGYMKLFTSMRVMDDVAHGISTFYAEILRIKAMAEYKEKEVPMICLIDEIFKGTNSADRIVGAKEAITRLAGDRCITAVSTHDFELCDIEDKDGHKAENYHFEEYYDNDELRFDYKICDGRCTTTNALAILRMAGFDIKK